MGNGRGRGRGKGRGSSVSSKSRKSPSKGRKLPSVTSRLTETDSNPGYPEHLDMDVFNALPSELKEEIEAAGQNTKSNSSKLPSVNPLLKVATSRSNLNTRHSNTLDMEVFNALPSEIKDEIEAAGQNADSKPPKPSPVKPAIKAATSKTESNSGYPDDLDMDVYN